MQNLSRSLKVGALLVAAVIASFVLWRTLFKGQGTGDGYRLYAMFDDAAGLVPRSRVVTAGIAIGEIERIQLENGRARVTIRVQGDIPVYRNATIARRAVSILGEFVLVVAPGNATTPRLRSGDRINTVFEGTNTDDIMRNVAAITRDVGRVTERLAASIGTETGQREIAETIRNVSELTAAINRTVQQNADVVTHTLASVDRITTQGGPEIQAMLSNLRVSTDRLAQILGRDQPQDQNTVTETQEAIRNIASASRELRQTLEHLNSTTGAVDRGEGSLGRLVRDETLIDEVQGTVQSINDFVGPISRLQTIVGLRSEYSFISNTLRSTVEVRLQPREDKYYLLEFIDDPRGFTRNISTVTDTTDPTMTAHVRSSQRVTTDAFRFSLMFARRLGPATFRFGIKESSGGLGLDLHLLDNALEVRTDVFAFGENTYPRLRIAAAINVLQRAWLIGGVDDVFNGDRFDYFLGAQLRFNDEDLKSILPFAGGLAGGGR
ncbi:MAG: MCE family protein [Myxococcaceae bacterium]|nr:MAG: MCE family protein [Myxococcaceae bacterium]